ncbi:MAG: imidazoleglycerol-phosphate dehydratase HisB [Alphaproteobacteria bacterium]
MRTATVKRRTSETDIAVSVSLDGTGKAKIDTGIGFFDHMLEQIARHGLIDMTVKASGDLHIDAHHTVEDVGIALGKALNDALGDMQGVTRYADVQLPMDEALTRCALDLSGRPFLVWKVAFTRGKIGAFDTELVREFFQALAQNARMTLHVETLYGRNNHHIAESCFKAVARALREATEADPRQGDRIPSTKGSLTG